MSIERDRENAKRRHDKRQARLAAKSARTQRNQQIIGAIVAVAVVSGGVVLLNRMTGSDTAAPAATEQPTPTTTTAPATPTTPPPSRPPQTLPPKTLAQGATWQATVKTSAGNLTFTLDGKKAPQTVSSFISLSQKKFFDTTKCHRLTTAGIFVLQCGDPEGTGNGGPGYGFGIENAPADGKYPAGTIAMARTQDPNSNGSQFFLVYRDSELPTQGGGYSIFGQVTDGLGVVKAIAAKGVADGSGDGAPKTPVVLNSVSVAKK